MFTSFIEDLEMCIFFKNTPTMRIINTLDIYFSIHLFIHINLYIFIWSAFTSLTFVRQTLMLVFLIVCIRFIQNRHLIKYLYFFCKVGKLCFSLPYILLGKILEVEADSVPMKDFWKAETRHWDTARDTKWHTHANTFTESALPHSPKFQNHQKQYSSSQKVTQFLYNRDKAQNL